MESTSVAVRVFGCSDVGRVRKSNEDAFVIADLEQPVAVHEMAEAVDLGVGSHGILLAVSDGMGGERAGEVASALTLQSLRNELPVAQERSAEAALMASVEKANRRVWDAAAHPRRKGMGATLTAVLIHGQRAYVAEVGDSRAYVLRGSRLCQVTHDQSYAQVLFDAGTLTREEVKTFQYRNVIMQAMGSKEDVVVALNRFTLRRGDRLLLCSDGLTGRVEDEELRQVLLSTASLDVACKTLVALANERGGEDNITVVVADLSGGGLPQLTGEERISLETVQAFTAPLPRAERVAR
jgi:serine/threonine protein phosphatase PrpC